MKKAISLLLAVTMAAMPLVGCGSKAPASSAAAPAASSQAQGASQAPAASEEPAEPEVPLIEEELYAPNGDKNIYGVMTRPDDGQEKYPVIIMSHGFAGSSKDQKAYAEDLAKAGYACIRIDFYGGGRASKSGGSMAEMSVKTEATDLSAVMDMVKGLDYVDPDRLFLFGASQGGFVSTMVAADRADEVKGLILLFPAYALQDDCWERHGSIENVPETEVVMNNTLSAMYSLDAMSFDIYEVMGSYTGPVLLLHGDKDTLVKPAYSERAHEVFENSELYIVQGAGHGFNGKHQKEASQKIQAWLQINDAR